MSRRTFAFLGLSLLVRPPIHTRLEDLVLALELVLELIRKLAGLVVVVLVDVHGTVAILDRLLLLLRVRGSLRHVGSSCGIYLLCTLQDKKLSRGMELNFGYGIDKKG
jgi:hypothetical protein